ncbi:MAG TPA: DUF2934 domain-containing protein [Azospirillum sp.]
MAKRKTATAAAAADLAATDAGAEAILRTSFSMLEQDALALMHSATLLIEADTPEKVSVALDHNLKLWVAIKTVVQDDANQLAAEIKENLRSLAQFVSATTMEATEGTIEARKLVSLARVNMHIAEGLLSGQKNKMVQERAYEIWEHEGRPEGRGMEHWLRAEMEISDLLKMR